MKIKAQIELELTVSDFYSEEDAIILCKTEISEALNGLCKPEEVKFNKNFLDVIENSKTDGVCHEN